jgi:hypothetical protein
MTKESEACEQSRLSKVAVETTELGMAQACPGDGGGGRGQVGHTQSRKRVMAATMVTGISRGGSSKPRGSGSRERKSV